MTLDCFCGAVRVTTARKPDFVHACNCDLCRKAGARWGYFEPAEVTVEGKSASYRRTDKDEPAVDVHFCRQCGSTTHFRLTKAAVATHGDTMMGVNVGLADESDLAGVELRYPDGKSWSGQGEFGYVRESRILGD
ncbi:MAG: GFA family protein [Sphingomonadaceae bacterium]|nr:GFA family protein [Sphingomonadaceae bacterium]MCP5384278.1 GFA family protein [Altererythrobacter sp.]MCP5391376.1 GFA family protein [Sphingomonadaceae bacterium]MCP5393605.1 GFA family protein [Sphingomonadaceae bacterium]